MLRYLRENQKTVLWILLGFIILPFIVYYGAPSGGGGVDPVQRNVATVNGKPVPWYEYERELSRIREGLRQEAQRRGQPVPREQERLMPEQAFENVTGLEILRQEADRLGIEVTDAEVKKAGSEQIQMLAQQFKSPQQKLSDFERIFISRTYPARSYAESVALFKQEIREQVLFDKVMRLPGYGTVISEADLREEFEHRNAMTKVETITFRPADYMDEVPKTVGDEELLAFLEENREQYREPLQAKIRYIHFQPSAFESRAREAVNPSDIQREFVARADEFRQPETRRVDHIVFAAEDYIPDATFSEDELQAYFSEHQSDYMTDARARVRYISIDPTTLQDDITVEEEDLQDFYEQNIFRYQTPETVQLSHILAEVPLVADEEEEEAALAKIQAAQERIAAGEPFEDVARDLSDDASNAPEGGDLGQVRRGMMVAPFEEAGFALEEGQISEPVKTRFGYHLIKAGEHVEASTTPFEEVRSKIYDEVVAQKALLEARSLATRIRNGLEAGLTQEAVGPEYTIRTTRLFSEDETVPLNEDLRDHMSTFTRTVFRLEEGEVSSPITLGDQVYVIERTEAVEPEAMSLADPAVREEVAADKAAEEAEGLAELAARQAWEMMRSRGTAFDDIAYQNDAALYQTDWLTRSVRQVPNVGSSPSRFLQDVFAAELGEVVLTQGPGGSTHLVRVTGIRDSVEPDFDELTAEQVNRIANQLVQEEAVRMAGVTAARFLTETQGIESSVNVAGLFNQYAQEYGVGAGTTDFFAAGEPVDNVLGYNPEVAEAAIDMATKGVAKGTVYETVIETGQQGQYNYTVFQLVDYQPAHLPDLDDIRTDVREDYLQELALKRARDAAEKAAEIIASELPATYPPPDGSRSVDLKSLAAQYDWNYVVTESFNREAYIPSVGTAPEFKKVAFHLEPGMVSGVITVSTLLAPGGDPKPSGYFILQVLEHDFPGESEFEAQKEQLARELENRRGNLASRSWFENLRERAEIEDLRVASAETVE